MFKLVARLILRNRLFILISIFLITAFMAFQARKVELSYEPTPLLPASDSAYIEFEAFKAKFGNNGNLIMMGFKDDMFSDVEKFNDWFELCQNIQDVDGVITVLSLANSFDIQKNTELKQFEYLPFITEKVKNKAELDSLKKKMHELKVYEEMLYDADREVYLTVMWVKNELLITQERERVVADIKHEIHAFQEKHPIETHVSGLPFIRVKTAEKIKKEMFMFIILAALVCALLLYMFFRSFKVVMFSLLVVIVGVTWGFGTFTLFGFRITALSAMIPPLLIVIGIPNSIFLLNKYHYEYKSHRNKIKALQRVISKIGSATFLTNLTTASGFATFIFTKTEILQEFGIIAAVNIIGVFILSITLIPIIFSYLAPPKERHTKHLENKLVCKVMDKLVWIVEWRRTKAYWVAGIALGLAIIGIMNVKSTGYMVDDLPHHDPIYKDLKFFEEHFTGIMPLEVVVETGKKRGALRNSALKKIDKLQQELDEMGVLAKPFSIVTAAKSARQIFYGGSETSFKLPSKNEQNFIMAYLRKDNDKISFTKNLIDSTGQTARIQYRVKDIGAKAMTTLQEDIQAKADSIFKSGKYNVRITGESFVFSKGNKYLINSLFTSLALAVLLISIFMAWMFASFRMVLFSLIPNILPLLITGAFMGYFGIPIKPSTVLIFSIAFGISVDDTIHYLAKYRQELKANNLDIRKSVINAVRETGVSMFYTSVILFFGFSMFAASGFGGTQAMGILVSLTLLIAMGSNLIILPSILLTYEKRIKNTSFKEPLLQIYDEEEDIELDELEIQATKNKVEEK